MASLAERASMREGPLAALFRKTEDGEGTERGGGARPPRARRPMRASPRLRDPSSREAGCRTRR